MTKFKILVTSIGTPIAHGVLKGLQEMDGVHIIGSDSRLITAGNAFCTRVYKVPRFVDNKESYMIGLQEIVHKEKIDAIFPCHAEEIFLEEDFKKHFSIPFALPKSSDFNSLRNKEQTYNCLIEKGLAHVVPAFYGFSTHQELLDLSRTHLKNEKTIVVKDLSGYGAAGLVYLTDKQQFLDAIESHHPYIYDLEDYLQTTITKRRLVMKRLDSPEYSVDIFMHEKTIISCIPRERTGVSSGLVLDGKIVNHEELIGISSQIAAALITDGFINFQFMKEDGHFKLTDVNPRFCGSQVMGLGAGVNFPELFIKYNLTDEMPVPEPKWGTRMLRYRESFFVSVNETDKDATDVWNASH